MNEIIKLYIDHLQKIYQQEIQKRRNINNNNSLSISWLVAMYTSCLPRDEQVKVYAQYLSKFNNSSLTTSTGLKSYEREDALKAAQNYGLDLNSITKFTVEMIFHNNNNNNNINIIRNF